MIIYYILALLKNFLGTHCLLLHKIQHSQAYILSGRVVMLALLLAAKTVEVVEALGPGVSLGTRSWATQQTKKDDMYRGIINPFFFDAIFRTNY